MLSRCYSNPIPTMYKLREQHFCGGDAHTACISVSIGTSEK